QEQARQRLRDVLAQPNVRRPMMRVDERVHLDGERLQPRDLALYLNAVVERGRGGRLLLLLSWCRHWCRRGRDALFGFRDAAILLCFERWHNGSEGDFLAPPGVVALHRVQVSASRV